MSSTPDYEHESSDLAGEYALGVLDGAERRAAERLAARDIGFAKSVEAWDQRLAPLFGAYPEVQPPASLWSRIEADLQRMTRAASPASSSQVRSPGRRVAGIWQWIGIAGMGLAATSLAALIVVAATDLNGAGQTAGSGGMMTATLASKQGTPMFTIVIDRSTSTAALIPVAGSVSNGRVPQLWLLPPGGADPRSLGVVDMTKPLLVNVAMPQVAMPDVALAVSLEPKGGSPTGLPTGPVVASGSVKSI